MARDPDDDPADLPARPETTDVLSPVRLVAGKYRLGRLLGEGGMGAVYEAEHTGLGTRVAVKLLGDRFADDPKSKTRFRREARNAAAVKHPNIVAVTDTGTDDEGIPFIVMELLEGESLSGLLKRERRLDAVRAASIAGQMLTGLAAAHDRNIIHRDLKPANVFLAQEHDTAERVKILDFGISKFFSENRSLDVTAEGAVLGTPHFMPPEQVRGHGDLDGRADLYAVGVMLYRMLTGRLPFTAREAEELYAQICAGKFTLPRDLRPEIAPALEQVVLKAMARERDERYPDARAFHRALLDAVPEAASTAGRTGTSSFPPPGSLPSDDRPPSGPRGARTTVPSGSIDASSGDSAEGQVTRPRRPPRRPPDPEGPGARPWRAGLPWVGAALLALCGGAAGLWALGSGPDPDLPARPSAPTPPPSAAAPATPPLHFAVTSYLPRADVTRIHTPFVRYLAETLGRPVELVILDDYVDVAARLEGADLDLAALSPYAYVRAKRAVPGLRLLATPIAQGGTSSYEGLILSRAGSDVQRLADLKRRDFCYVSPASTSGYLYPRAVLRREGIDPDTDFRATRFTGDHLSALRALISEACDGAAVFADALYDANQHGMPRDAFRVLASTDRIPHDAYCLGTRVPDELAEAMGRALLALAPDTELAKRTFAPEAPIKGFARGNDRDYESVRSIERFLDTRR